MKNNFLENFIFEKEKNCPFGNSKYFYKKLHDKYNIIATAQEYGELYRRILNYQINKYGCSLNPRERAYTVEDGLKAQEKVNRSHRLMIKRRQKKKYEEN